MPKVSRSALALVFTGVLVLAACGDDDTSSNADATSTTSITEAAPLSEADFVEQADQICFATGQRFGELEDPDGEGGAKPIGLGGFIRDWVTELRTLSPPTKIADDWEAGLDLLVQSADKLDMAEAGDPEAEGEALFVLQAEAQEHFDAMDVPFQGCFVD